MDATWHTEEGEAVQLGDLRGKVMVMVMIYTSCKAACPRLVADMRSLHDKVPAGLGDEVRYVLVSIDPVNDTPEKLKAFAISKEMDGEEWTFLQGNEDTVRELANILAVKYKSITPVDFSHSNIISVFDPSGELVHQQEGLGLDNSTTVEKIIQTANAH
jgi:protein SCO1/2